MDALRVALEQPRLDRPHGRDDACPGRRHWPACHGDRDPGRRQAGPGPGAARAAHHEPRRRRYAGRPADPGPLGHRAPHRHAGRQPHPHRRRPPLRPGRLRHEGRHLPGADSDERGGHARQHAAAGGSAGRARRRNRQPRIAQAHRGLCPQCPLLPGGRAGPRQWRPLRDRPQGYGHAAPGRQRPGIACRCGP